MIMNNILPPAVILILGSFFVPFFKGKMRNVYVILLPLLTFVYIYLLGPASQCNIPFLNYQLSLLRVDGWSKVFGYVFTLSVFAAFIYGFYKKRGTDFMSALLYIGSALGVIFAGDLISVYIFWELMAVTSVIMILARKTKKSEKAAVRYILVHIFGGLMLLAGIILYINQTGSIIFSHFTEVNIATSLMLMGFLVNAAAVPFSSWLPDAYPESTVMGGVILSAYTSKTAVYTLIRGFPGWDILIALGCVMTIYGIIYALLENDMRRILAYSIINQVGFMVCAVGIGTPLALAGAAAHAFCHIIYKALLWMSAGAVLHRTGKSKCTELGGLYQTMPWTLIFGGIGALAISAVPFTSGFTSKTIILAAAQTQQLFWVWLVLEVASAGVFLHAGIKFPYFVFFAKDSGLRPREADKSMLFAMGFLAAICIYLGCFPRVLYNILPGSEIVKSIMPVSFVDIYIHHFAHVVTQWQILVFSALVFFLFLPLLKRTNTIAIDFDWFYRKGTKLFMLVISKGLTAVNNLFYWVFIEKITGFLISFVKCAPSNILILGLTPYWVVIGLNEKQRTKRKQGIYRDLALNTLPVGLVAGLAVIFLGLLFFI